MIMRGDVGRGHRCMLRVMLDKDDWRWYDNERRCREGSSLYVESYVR